MNRVIYFIYGAGDNPQPLDLGTVVYARVFTGEYSYKDYKWDTTDEAWVDSDYLGYLTTTGSPDLDNVDPDDLPALITKF